MLVLFPPIGRAFPWLEGRWWEPVFSGMGVAEDFFDEELFRGGGARALTEGDDAGSDDGEGEEETEEERPCEPVADGGGGGFDGALPDAAGDGGERLAVGEVGCDGLDVAGETGEEGVHAEGMVVRCRRSGPCRGGGAWGPCGSGRSRFSGRSAGIPR